jgi:hypothetical protein
MKVDIPIYSVESCSQKTAASQSSVRLLLIYNLWSLIVRVFKYQVGCNEALKSR